MLWRQVLTGTNAASENKREKNSLCLCFEASNDIRLGDKKHFIRYDWQEIHLLWQFNAPIMEKKNNEMSNRHDLWTNNVLVFFTSNRKDLFGFNTSIT